MNKKQLLVLVACCVLTGFATRFIVYRSVRTDFRQATDLYEYRPAFEEFLQERELADGEQVKGDNLPDRLRAIEIVNVYRNGRFVYFVLPSNCFIGDCWTAEFIWQLDDRECAIEEILRTTQRKTYQIQRYNSSQRWYFWFHG